MTTRDVLIVEDDPLSARLIELALRSQPYQFHLAHDGKTALKIANKNSLDLILLDLLLPGMDGIDVLRQLKAKRRTASVPVVVITSKKRAQDKQTALSLGVKAYFIKPYDQKELLRVCLSLAK